MRSSASSPHGRWCLLQGQSWPKDFLLNLRGRCRHLRELSWPDDVVYVVYRWTWTFFLRSLRIGPCSAQSTWPMRSSPRPIMTKRCSAQSAWTMTSSPGSVMTRRWSAQSTYRWWRRVRDMSWPDNVLCVIHVVYDFFSNVNHDQTMFCVVHIDYGVVPQVYHDRTMFCVVHVDYDLVSEVNDQTVFSSSWFMWTMSLSTMLIMTRRPDWTPRFSPIKWSRWESLARLSQKIAIF